MPKNSKWSPVKRQLALIPATLLLVGTLTSCTPEEAPSASDCTVSGAASDSITVEGEFGTKLTLTSELPDSVDTTERTVIETGLKGNTDPIDLEDSTFTSLTVFDGADGSVAEFTQTMLDGKGGYAEWVKQTLNCASGGDRVVIVAPKQEVLGEANAEPGENLIIVSDLYVPGLEHAEGTEVELPAGTPEVSIADNGEPTITVPDDVTVPTSLTVHTMVEGEGDVIEPGDMVFVHYRGVILRTGEEFDSSWSRGAYSNFNAATQEEAAEVGATLPVIAGFRDALVGQTVGSRVMSLVPAEDGGYGGERLEQMGHQKDDVMVFVLDILGALPAIGSEG